MLPALLAIASLRYQNPTAGLDLKVDFTCPATRAELVLKQLSAKTGVAMEANATMAPDVLVIRVQGVPLQDLLDRIATVSGGEWKRDHEVLYLKPSVTAEHRQHRELARDFAARLNDAIQGRLGQERFHQQWTADEAAKLAKETEMVMNPKNDRIDTDNKAVKALMGRGPLSKLTTRVVAQLGADEIADHVDGLRTVFASHPTRMQFGMPGARGVLEQFLADQILFVDATKAFLAGQPDNPNHYEVGGVDRGVFQGGDPRNGLGQSLLQVTGDYRYLSLNVNLIVADGAGKVLSQAYDNYVLTPRRPTEFAPVGDDAPIPLDSLTKEFKRAIQVPEREGQETRSFSVSNDTGVETLSLATPTPIRQVELSPQLQRWINSPGANEPMNLSAGQLLNTSAQRRGDNLVADLDDRSFGDALQAHNGKLTPSSWLSSQDLQQSHEVTESSGWLMVSLRDIAGARRARINRGGLANLLGDLARRKLLSLEAISAYAQTQFSPPSDRGFDFDYMKVVNAAATTQTYQSDKWPLYRLYGTLTAGQRNALSDGKVIPASSLTHAAMAALQSMVFLSNAPPRVTDATGKTVDPGDAGFIADWTNLLPDGVPGHTGISAKVSVTPGAYCYSESKRLAEIRSVDAIAKDQLITQTPVFAKYAPAFAYDHFAPAQIKVYKFAIEFGEGIGLDGELTDGTYDDSMAPKTMGQMPPDFRNAVTARLTRLKSFFGHLADDPQGGPIPP